MRPGSYKMGQRVTSHDERRVTGKRKGKSMRTERTETPLQTLKIFGHLTQAAWFKNSNMAHVFLYLLLSAKYVRRTGNGTIASCLAVKTSGREIAKATGIPFTSVKRALKGLISQTAINIAVNKGKGREQSTVTITLPNVYDFVTMLSEIEAQKTGPQPLQKVAHKIPGLTALQIDEYENGAQKTDTQISENVIHKPSPSLARSSLYLFEDKWLDYTRTNSSSSARACVREKEPTADQIRAANRQYAITAANDPDFIGFVSTALLIEQKAVSTLVNIFANEVNAKNTPHTDAIHFRRHFFDWARINITMKNGKRQRTHHDAAIEADRRRYGLPADR